jgi:hypothetical protein
MDSPTQLESRMREIRPSGSEGGEVMSLKAEPDSLLCRENDVFWQFPPMGPGLHRGDERN